MIQEVRSHERRRIFGASNLRAVRDGWRILKVIIRERAAVRRAAPAPAAVLPAELAEVMNMTGEGA